MGLADMLKDSRTRARGYEMQVRRTGISPGDATGVGTAYNGNRMDTRRQDEVRRQAEHVGGWVYAANRPIAERIAGQPLTMGRRVGAAAAAKHPAAVMAKALAIKGLRPWSPVPKGLQPYSPNLDPITASPFLDLMARPNSLMTGWALMAVTVFSLQYTGEAYWMLSPGTGENGADELYHIPTHWVRPIHTPERAFDSYVLNPRNAGDMKPIPRELMFRFHYPDPFDPLGVTCPLKMCAKAVSADENIQTTQDRTFKNGVWPGLVFTVGSQSGIPGVDIRPKLTIAQRREIIGVIKELHRGSFKWDEPIILDQLIQNVHKITNSAKELDFLQSGKITKARIFQTFGTNPIIAGEIENANRATAAVADENFVHGTINPKIDQISQCLTALAIWYTGDASVLAYLESCRPNDPEMQLKELEMLIKSGSLTRNEVRAVYGWEPLPGEAGDTIVLMPGQAIVPSDVSAHDGSATTGRAPAAGGTSVAA